MSTPGPEDIRAKVSTRAFGNPVIQNDFRGIVAETIVESGEEAMLLPWVTDTLRQVLPRLIATGVATEDDIEIDTLTERLQWAAVELRSQLELVPQMCGWTRV